jgi:transposase
MARYKVYDYNQTKLIPIDYSKQILPHSFEHAVSFIVDHRIDTSVFDAAYCNDDTGAPAYDPAILLKIVLYAYSRGIISSREIARACDENIIFMALSADTRPHFTTIAAFISGMDKAVESVFADVLLLCDELGLIGREMFAIDGCKLPSNASKEWSGTKAELQKKQTKMREAVTRMRERHQQRDAAEAPRPTDPSTPDSDNGNGRDAQYIATLEKRIAKLQDWLDHNDDRTGAAGRVVKSNVTDNDSAKMKTSHGVIQGYNGVAAVDAKHQIIVHAEAFGQGPENNLLMPILDGARKILNAVNPATPLGADLNQIAITADSGFHSRETLEALERNDINAWVADRDKRSRDPRFADRARYQRRHRQERERYEGRTRQYTAKDFRYDPDTDTCHCPAGHQLYSKGRATIRGYKARRFGSSQRICDACDLRTRCFKNPDKTRVRQVAIFLGKSQPTGAIERMKARIDSEPGQRWYDRRLPTVEPVFGNQRNHRRDRFTLRGKTKVNTQWRLYSLVHNIGKAHASGGLAA